MSETFRERLRRRGKEVLGINESELQYMWSNIGDFCNQSDEDIQKIIGKKLNQEDVEKCTGDMSDTDFDQFAREVILKVLRKHGFRKKKKGDNDVYEVDEVYVRASEEQGQRLIEEQAEPMKQRIEC